MKDGVLKILSRFRCLAIDEVGSFVGAGDVGAAPPAGSLAVLLFREVLVIPTPASRWCS